MYLTVSDEQRSGQKEREKRGERERERERESDKILTVQDRLIIQKSIADAAGLGTAAIKSLRNKDWHFRNIRTQHSKSDVIMPGMLVHSL